MRHDMLLLACGCPELRFHQHFLTCDVVKPKSLRMNAELNCRAEVPQACAESVCLPEQCADTSKERLDTGYVLAVQEGNALLAIVRLHFSYITTPAAVIIHMSHPGQ